MSKQKTTMKNTLILTLLAMTFAIAALTGCGKSAVSIVGTWNLSSQKAVQKINNVVLRDTSFAITGLQLIFGSDGHYVYSDHSGTEHGTYTYTNSALAVYDSVGHTRAYFPTTTLSDHLFSYNLMDTLHGSADTISTFTLIYSR